MGKRSANRGRILVCHSDHDVRSQIRRALGSDPEVRAESIREASDAGSARRAAMAWSPELVLSTPELLSGLWTEETADAPFPVIVLTQTNDSRNLSHWLERGAMDALPETLVANGQLPDVVIRARWSWRQAEGRRLAEAKLMRLSGRIDPRRLSPDQMKPNEAVLYALYDGVMCGVVVQRESDGKYIDCNQEAVRIYGARSKTELLNRHPADLSPVTQPGGLPSRHLAESHMARAYDEGSHQFEWTSRRFDGTEYVSETFLTSIDLGDQRVLMAVFVDISARKRAEEALQKSEEKYRRLVEGLRNEYFFYMHDAEGLLTYVSPSVHQVLGYRPEELVGRCYRELMTGNPLNHRADEHNREAIEGGAPPVHEAEVMHGDGSVRTIEVLEVPVTDATGLVTSVEGIIRDVSEQRQSEVRIRELNADLEARVQRRTQQLESVVGELRREVEERREVEAQLRSSQDELRSLSNYLLSVREEERSRIAREIHDELGQNLTAMKLDLSLIGRRLGQDDDAIRERLPALIGLADETILSVRRICSELRPAVLDNLGLAAAMEWLLEEMESRSGIACRAVFSPEDIDLPTDQGTALFRVFQEALTNVARHSDATALDVSVRSTGEALEMAVEDNGVGIRPEVVADPRAFGIVGMRERIRSIGGRLEIRGVPGHGTRMEVTVPLASRGCAA